MKITIENTTKIVKANGVDCRIWEGVTASGIKVVCLIARIAVKYGEDTSQFDAELREMKAPTADAAVYPLRLIL